MTLAEFADLLGVERSAATRRMRALLAAGRVVSTRKRVRTSDGRVYPAPAFRLVIP